MNKPDDDQKQVDAAELETQALNGVQPECHTQPRKVRHEGKTPGRHRVHTATAGRHEAGRHDDGDSEACREAVDAKVSVPDETGALYIVSSSKQGDKCDVRAISQRR